MDIVLFLEEHWIWILLAGFAVVPYLLFPCLIKFTQRFRKEFSVDVVDVVATPLPKEVSRYFQGVAEQMNPIGFQLVNRFLVPDLMDNVVALVAVFENRKQGDVALAAVMYGFRGDSSSDVLLQEKHVEFANEFADGTEISTNNNLQESAFKPVARRKNFYVPGEHNLSRLYEVHQHLVREHSHSPKRELPNPDSWADEIKKDMSSEFSEQIETGLLKDDATGDFYVLTWGGAYSLTWKQLWPIAPIRLAIRRKKAKEWLRQVQSHLF